ncbi:PadR family transcriptional regulator [Frankia sp. Cas3]|uniref:PadR family transcriptional regulator n=1 Tax=Frankia sp. Cas3 TaxID=3073926 RepID=UPI002AD3E8EF|nr:helix-turn-helix transcriptional regulator [Frankia sp. Cas3]
MTGTRRSSPQTVAVLRALIATPTVWRYGYELGQEVGLKAGSLYPILIRLADRGLLETCWEQRSDELAGRPPRHLYRLTGAGRELANQLAPVSAPAPIPVPVPVPAERHARGDLRTA